MPKSYTPNWFLPLYFDNHINQMMARYSLPAGLTHGFLLQERYA